MYGGGGACGVPGVEWKKRNTLRARGQSDQILCESLRGFFVAQSGERGCTVTRLPNTLLCTCTCCNGPGSFRVACYAIVHGENHQPRGVRNTPTMHLKLVVVGIWFASAKGFCDIGGFMRVDIARVGFEQIH